MAMGPLNTGGDGAVEATLAAHLAAKNPHSVTYQDVGADPAGAASTAQSNAQRYTDTAISTAIGGLDTGVVSFNGRKGTVTPQQGDYTPEQVGAAPAQHGTHVTYSDTAPLPDGMASAGVAAEVARADHRHPTDTTRAASNHKHTAADVGAASSNHTHKPGDITSLVGTDYSTSRVRGIHASQSVLYSVSNGCIALVYL